MYNVDLTYIVKSFLQLEQLAHLSHQIFIIFIRIQALLSQQISVIEYSIINFSHSVMQENKRSYSSHNWKLTPFQQPLPVSSTPCPWKPAFCFCEFEFLFLRFYIQVMPCNICFPVQLISLNIIVFRYIQILNGRDPFFLKLSNMLLYVSYFLYSFKLVAVRLFPHLDYCE